MMSALRHLEGELNGRPSLDAAGAHAGWLSSGNHATRLVVAELATGRTVRHPVPLSGRCRSFHWSSAPGIGLAMVDVDGTEDCQLYQVRPAERSWRPVAGPRARQLRLVAQSDRRPHQIVVSLIDGTTELPEYRRIDLLTGQRTSLLRDRGFSAVYFDQQLRPRLFETVDELDDRHLFLGDPQQGRLFLRIEHGAGMSVRVMDFTADGRSVHLVMPDGDAGMRLVRLPLVAATERTAPAVTLCRVHRADFTDLFFDAATDRLQLAQVEGSRTECRTFDQASASVIDRLRDQLGSEPTVLQRRADGRVWLVSVRHPCRPDRYFVYQAERDSCRQLSERRPGQPAAALRCSPVEIPLRDGHRAPGYLSRPASAGPGPQPIVLLVHGGPWRRVRWEYSERRTRLVDLGYTVLEPNFRGSTGFGAGWINAADRQWGRAMQADLEDALTWALDNGIGDADRIALFGGSYGGYAVLQLAATSTVRFRCVVAGSPVTDLVAFVESPPPFWRTAQPMLRRRIGDPALPGTRAELLNHCPVTVAAAIECPVLLLHGLNDSRVPVRMSSELLLAMARAGRTASLAIFGQEGHEVVSATNRRRYESLIEQFLLRELSGVDAPAESGVAEAEYPETSARLFHTPAAERVLVSGGRHGTAVPS